VALSRQGGGRAAAGMGFGGRGPGETQLEVDRRRIHRRLRKLKDDLATFEKVRRTKAKEREDNRVPIAALVGYTNAGKTTILNALSGAGRSTRDRLFETLETTTRLVEGARVDGDVSGTRPDFVVTDTVGFIRKLPTQLVHSFASTLEATRDADVKVLCTDASSEELEEEIQTVGHTLSETLDNGAGPGSTILCLNKMDLVSEEREGELRRDYPGAVMISALLDGCDALLEEIYRTIASGRERMEVLIPHAEYAAASRLYGTAEIHAQEDREAGLWMDVSLPRSASAKYAPYRV
jgi:GTPase